MADSSLRPLLQDPNPYRSPSVVGDVPAVVGDAPASRRLTPHPTARLASIVLITLGLVFLGITTVSTLFRHLRPIVASGNPALPWSQSLRDFLAILLLSLQVYAGFRSWNYRIPLIGGIATFAMCVVMTDTKAAAVYSPACLASVGVLFYTGWVRSRLPTTVTSDGG